MILAGFNLDIETIKDLANSSVRSKKRIILTPETISAAYARISRSPKSVEELRKKAREEVAKARKSNRRIIFEMGHHSVAEHAVFNFDIIGISRRAVEELEKFRLCSYTEKSQRYVTLKGDFIIPEEIKKTNLIDGYLEVINLQNNFYLNLFNKLKILNFKKIPALAKDLENRRTLENWAKEDARYILSLATQTQLGATINARNLELMIRRFASHNLSEINDLGKKFYRAVKKIAPSIMLFFRANDYDQKTYLDLKKFVRRIGVREYRSTEDQTVKLVDFTKNGDDRILATILFRVKNLNYSQCLRIVRKMTKKEKLELFKRMCQYMELYDTAPREFEYANLTYSLVVSAGCFGQLKRHRLATLTCQDYNPELGFTIPDSIKEIGESKKFTEIIKKTENAYQKIEKRFPGLGSYLLTNAHRKRVLLNVNLRELYHISRLREDPTAQWDIRAKAQKMSRLAKKVMPITTSLLGGKTNYQKIYYELFGKNPKITEVPPVR